MGKLMAINECQRLLHTFNLNYFMLNKNLSQNIINYYLTLNPMTSFLNDLALAGTPIKSISGPPENFYHLNLKFFF